MPHPSKGGRPESPGVLRGSAKGRLKIDVVFWANELGHALRRAEECRRALGREVTLAFGELDQADDREQALAARAA